VPFIGVTLAIILSFAAVNGLFDAFIPRFCIGSQNLNEIYYAYNVWCERRMQLPVYLHFTQLLTIGLAALIFCNFAVRSVSKRHWMWAACGICSVQGAIWTAILLGRGFSYGYLIWPKEFVSVESAAIPIIIGVWMEIRQSRFPHGVMFERG
jgi:hypothetical protein